MMNIEKLTKIKQNWLEKAALMQTPEGDICVVLFSDLQRRAFFHYLSKDDCIEWARVLAEKAKTAKNWSDILGKKPE